MILGRFQAARIRMIRLDAVGYAIKKRGTSCFMIPETFQFIETLSGQAHGFGMEVLVEIHSHHLQQVEIGQRVDWVYDFALPPLILHALFSGDAKPLVCWLAIRPRNSITVLDTHDGIGVIDVGAGVEGEPGLLAPADIERLVETIHSRSQGGSRLATGAAANNLDLYQVNCTFFDALGRRASEYLIARAVQFFTPGIPQVYYVGLLAGTNDIQLLAKTKAGRDVNRHHYTLPEVDKSLTEPVVRSLLELIRFRNIHPAFAGQGGVDSPSNHSLTITWKQSGHMAKLELDFSEPRALITYSTEDGAGQLTIDISESSSSATKPEKAT